VSPQALSIAEQLAYCTVRLECDVPDGVSTGTGFFFNFAEQGDKAVPAIVTNRHVVKDATAGRFHLTVRTADGDPMVGSTVSVVLDKFASRWIPHSSPDVDLCAMPLGSLLQQAESKGKAVFYRHFAMAQVATDSDLQDLDQIEDITMVGYPTGLWETMQDSVARRSFTRRARTCAFLIRRRLMNDLQRMRFGRSVKPANTMLEPLSFGGQGHEPIPKTASPAPS
jgi:hypothetical protein